jgi:nucleotide-binding universal stress UspA family protein
MSCYRNILVAVDGSPDAEAALEHAVTLARDQRARLTLLTVVPPPPTPVGPGVMPPPELTDVHEAIIRDAVATIPDDVGVTTRIEQGAAAEGILRVAEAGGHDLIVMGSHGYGRVHTALLGSVSQRVLHGAAVPVLLMHARRDTGQEN